MADGRIFIALILTCQSLLSMPGESRTLNATHINLSQNKTKATRLEEKLDNLLWFSVRAKRDATGNENNTKGAKSQPLLSEQRNANNRHKQTDLELKTRRFSSNNKRYSLKQKFEMKQKYYRRQRKANLNAISDNEILKLDMDKHGHRAMLPAHRKKTIVFKEQETTIKGVDEKLDGQKSKIASGRLSNDDIKTQTNNIKHSSLEENEHIVNREDKAILGGEEEELAEFWPRRSFDNTLSKRSKIVKCTLGEDNDLHYSEDNAVETSSNESGEAGNDNHSENFQRPGSNGLKEDKSGSGEDLLESGSSNSVIDESEEIMGSGKDFLETGSGDRSPEFRKTVSEKAQEIIHKLDYGLYSGINRKQRGNKIGRNSVNRNNSRFVSWKATAHFSSKNTGAQFLNCTLGEANYKFYYLRDAVQKGALCLDGSKPGYYLRQGSDEGRNKWIIYLKGGAWCTTKQDCYERAQTEFGSSDKWRPVVNTEGILSPNKKDNKHFYNWNVAYVKYCDGGSYSGNRSEPVKVEGKLIYFRGKRILSAIVDDLLTAGMKHARSLVFTGTSAGGLSVILHADYIRSRIPEKTSMYSLADDGYFLDVPSTTGSRVFREDLQEVCKLQKCSRGVNRNCVASLPENEHWKCLFPQYSVKYVRSKIYIVNSLYDSWQIFNILGIECSTHVEDCSEEDLESIMKYKSTTVKALRPVRKNLHMGLYALSCLQHGETMITERWNKIKVKGHSISTSFVAWMKDQGKRLLIDSDDYPNNKSCL